MAIVVTLSNHAKFQIGKALIDLSTGDKKVILMNNTFAFDKDTHATLADVTADQLATGGGYTQDDEVLTLTSYLEDDTNDKATAIYVNPTWAGTGGGFGPTGALIVYDDVTVDKTVIFCADFGVDYTIAAGVSFQPQDITISVA